MSATLAGVADETLTLEQRVAALEAALGSLMHTLIRRGDISINDARAAMGLKPFEFLDSEPA